MKSSPVTGKWPERSQDLIGLLRDAANGTIKPEKLAQDFARIAREIAVNPDILRGTAVLIERGWANSPRCFAEDVVTKYIETERPVPNAKRLAQITQIPLRTAQRVLAELGVASSRGRPRKYAKDC